MIDRRRRIGSGDIAAIAGVSPYGTPLTVYHEKTTDALPEADSLAIRRGIRMEPVLAAMYEDAHGGPLSPVDTLYWPGREFLSATPDRVTQDGRLVELKTHSAHLRHTYGEPGTDQIPAHILVQVTWQILIARQTLSVDLQADVFAMFGFDDYGTWYVEYDDDLAAMLEDRAERFWRSHVLQRVPPPATGHQAELRAISALFPRSTDAEVKPNEDILSAVNELRLVRQTLAAAEAEERALKARIQQFMGSASVLALPDGGRITWREAKPSVRTICDYGAFKEADPELYARVVTTIESGGGRRFITPRAWAKEE